MSIIGPMITGKEVEERIAAVLLEWLPTYIHEVEDQEGITRGSIPAPTTFTRTNDFRSLPDDPKPTLLIVSPGLYGPPVREAEEYSAKWRVTVGVIANTPAGRDDVRNLAQYYIAAIRTLMIQKQGEFCEGVEWLDEGYQDIGTLNERSHSAARVLFAVEVTGVSLRPGGPPAPDPAADSPHADWPQATVVDTTITEEAIS